VGNGLPSGRAVGILKWTFAGSNHDDFISWKFNCWPEEEARGQMNVSIEYSMDLKDVELYDVNIHIPLGTNAPTTVMSIDGTLKHNPGANELVWNIDLIDKHNANSSLEFTISQKDSDDKTIIYLWREFFSGFYDLPYRLSNKYGCSKRNSCGGRR